MEALELATLLKSSRGVPLSVRQSGAVRSTSGGSYGSVLVFDEFVVKTWDDSDPAYSAWLDFVMSADPSATYYKHLPKVIWADLDLHIAILERLEETSRGRYCGSFLPCSLDDDYGFWKAGADHQTFRWSRALFNDMEACGLFRDFREDTHRGNTMFRRDGRSKIIVVTDPLAPRD
jgi:hypothetical protein